MSPTLKKLLPVLILAACAAIAVFLARSGKPPETQPPEVAALLVEAVNPRISDGPFLVRGQGTVTPKNQTELVSEVAGKVIWLSDKFVAGGVFGAGEVLARIDPSDYRTALLAAEAELAAARATLADEQARSDAAREDFRRLYGDSRQPTELLLRLPQVRRAEAAVQAQQAAVARARRNLERTEINLPFNGMIRARNVDLGQYVSVGSGLGTAFSTDIAEVRVPLAPEDLAFLDIGYAAGANALDRPVSLLGSVAGQPVRRQARLVRTEGVVNDTTRLTFVVAELQDPYSLRPESDVPPLPVGTFVEAEITGRDSSGLAVLPNEALHTGDRIYLADADDRLQIRQVDVIRSTPREVYVSSDLASEARVIVTAIPTPVPGLKLNVREVESPGPELRIRPAPELAASETGAGQ